MIRSVRWSMLVGTLAGAATLGAVVAWAPVGDARPADESPAPGVATTVASSGPGEEVAVARLREPVEGLTAPVPTRLTGVIETDDELTLLATFWSGDEACVGLDHVEVDETDEAVTIGVFVGSVPDHEACLDVARPYATAVGLGSPLGDRRVLDASVPEAAGSPEPADPDPTADPDPDAPAAGAGEGTASEQVVEPEPRPDVEPGSADEAAWDFFEAWVAGDAGALGAGGTPTVVEDALDAASLPGATDGWFHSRCEASGSRSYCTWVRPGERLQLVLRPRGSDWLVEELSVATLEQAGTARQLFFSWVAGSPNAVAALTTEAAAAQAEALEGETVWAWQYRNCSGSAGTVTCRYETTTRQLLIEVDLVADHYLVSRITVSGR